MIKVCVETCPNRSRIRMIQMIMEVSEYAIGATWFVKRLIMGVCI